MSELNEASLALAAVGDVRQIPVSLETPEGWHDCDGSEQATYAWPDFASAMKIGGAKFSVPSPLRTHDGHRYIIKLGRRRVLPTAPTELPEDHPLNPKNLRAPGRPSRGREE